eukprot:CAMPEP_0185728716 /NCGR_PEP_ID=MMETSP1171-20130828/4075_1 /TAXON_ID=374046 /ORGANISM="Helicotheca tamensis, Strain CCMP826" /LENGTH=201 /DNA_ID=CAMNT_0028397453 /DNA_START=231 /DNA_END=836 /DNA_ORIENTATION=+
MTDEEPNFGRQKRRKFHPSDNTEMSSSTSTLMSTQNTAFPAFVASPFAQSSAVSTPKPFGLNGSSLKRCRTEAEEASGNYQQHTQQQLGDLKRAIDDQSNEIKRLKTEKAVVENSLSELKATHEKTENENRILKRAVTIQQERQNQAATELDAARRYKEEADERARRLEQMILTLRYHLQAQNPSAGNDFMGFSPRPPDVF